MSWFQRLNCAIFGHRWGTCNAVCDACGAENPRLTKIRREHGDGPDIRTDGGQPSPGTDRSEGAELVISQGHKVVYHHDGEEQVGMIREFEGDYIRLNSGISVHASQIRGYVIYGDESEVNLIWESEVSADGE